MIEKVLQLLLVLVSSSLLYTLIGAHMRRDFSRAWKDIRQLFEGRAK